MVSLLLSTFAILAGACAALWVGEAEAPREKQSDESNHECEEDIVSPFFTILGIFLALCGMLLDGLDRLPTTRKRAASSREKRGDKEIDDFATAEPRTKVWMNEVVEQAENFGKAIPETVDTAERTAFEELVSGDQAKKKNSPDIRQKEREGNGNSELTFSFCSQSPSEPGYRQMSGAVPAEPTSTVTTSDDTWEEWRTLEGDRKDSLGSTKVTMLHGESRFSDDSKSTIRAGDVQDLDFGDRTTLPPIIGEDELQESRIYYELVNGKPVAKPRNTSLETFDDLGGEALVAKVKYSSEFTEKLKRKAKKIFGLHQEEKLDRHSNRAKFR